MIVPIESVRTAFNPSARGYHMVYREDVVNHCPGCGRTHWLIGRTTAECGFCATALPLAESFRQSMFVGSTARRSAYPKVSAAA